MDEFVCQIGGKNEGLLGPSNFHVNMTYVLSTMFCVEPNQLAMVEGDYLAIEPMMALVSVEKDRREKEAGMTGLPEPTKK